MQKFEHFALSLAQTAFGWHQEDSWAASDKFPIFAVADGVTLPGFEELEEPSASKRAADAFCSEAVSIIEKNFDSLKKESFDKAYETTDQKIREINNRCEIPISTVATLVAVKNGCLFGTRVTDCGFGLFRNGRSVFQTPEYWSWARETGRQGYGVLNGSGKIASYVDFWQIPHKKDDVLALWSDGFENHFANRDFIRLFESEKFTALKNDILELDGRLIEKDAEKYDHERTLLAVLL